MPPDAPRPGDEYMSVLDKEDREAFRSVYGEELDHVYESDDELDNEEPQECQAELEEQ